MKYYRDRVEAFAAIDKMVVDGMEEEDICFKIATMYGYGTKFVQERIAALQRMVERKKMKKEDK